MFFVIIIKQGTATIANDKITIKQAHEVGTKITKTYDFSDPEYELIIVSINFLNQSKF